MKITTFVLIFFTLISTAQKLEGNKHIDSLLLELTKMKNDTSKVNMLNKISIILGGIEPSQSKSYSIKALALSKKIKWQDGIANSYNVLSTFYILKMDFKNAIYYSKLALKSTKNKDIILQAYNNLSKCYLKKSELTTAIYFSNLALKLSENINDSRFRPETLYVLGEIYYNLKDFDKSIKFSKESLSLLDLTFKMSRLISSNYMVLGSCYIQKKDFNLASVYFDKCINSSIESGYNFNTVINLSDVISVFNDNSQFKKALLYQNKLDTFLKEKNFPSSFCEQLSGNPKLYLENAKIATNKTERDKLLTICITKAKKRIEISDKIETMAVMYDDYYILSQAQKLKGDYKQALESHEQYVLYKDSIFNSDNKETIKNLEDKREIELRDKQIQIDSLSLKAKEKQKWFLISGIVLLAIIGSLLFYQNKIRKKTNQKLQILNTNLDQANKTKIKLLSILNHDLRSPVNSFIHYIQFQKENPDVLDDETKSRIENETLASAKNLLFSMEDILLWTKDQMENFNPIFKNIAINSIFRDTENHFSTEKKVLILFENPQNLNLHTDENFLKTIIRNLTANAIKALAEIENPTIIWKAWSENNMNYLAVTDNGKGISSEEFRALYDDEEMIGTNNGLGLHLIRDLAKAIDCTITVDSQMQKGTTITLKF